MVELHKIIQPVPFYCQDSTLSTQRGSTRHVLAGSAPHPGTLPRRSPTEIRSVQPPPRQGSGPPERRITA